MPDSTRSDDRANGADERLQAVERALTGSDTTVSDIADGAEATAERQEIGSRLDALEARVEELEAATQALRGYAGAVRAVNVEVERRADLALARASRGQAHDDSSAAGADSKTENDGISDVPTASALDAAVPSDSASGGTGTQCGEGRTHNSTDGCDGTDGYRKPDEGDRKQTHTTVTDERSWSRGALDRLRESL